MTHLLHDRTRSCARVATLPMADGRRRRVVAHAATSYNSLRSTQHVPQDIEMISMHRAGGQRYVATATVAPRQQGYVQYMDRRGGLHLVPVMAAPPHVHTVMAAPPHRQTVMAAPPHVRPVIVTNSQPATLHIKTLESGDGNWTIKATKRVAPKPPLSGVFLKQDGAVAGSVSTHSAPHAEVAKSHGTAARAVYRPHTDTEESRSVAMRGMSRTPFSASAHQLSRDPTAIPDSPTARSVPRDPVDIPDSLTARSAVFVTGRDRRDYFTYDTVPRNFFRQGKQREEDVSGIANKYREDKVSGIAKATVGMRKVDDQMVATAKQPSGDSRDAVYAGEVICVKVPLYDSRGLVGSSQKGGYSDEGSSYDVFDDSTILGSSEKGDYSGEGSSFDRSTVVGSSYKGSSLDVCDRSTVVGSSYKGSSLDVYDGSTQEVGTATVYSNGIDRSPRIAAGTIRYDNCTDTFTRSSSYVVRARVCAIFFSCVEL